MPDQDRIEEFKEVVEIMPDDPVVRFGLAGAYLDAGQADAAVVEYGEAIRLKPDYSAAHRGLGRALERAGRIAEAKAAYAKGLEVATHDRRSPDREGDRGLPPTAREDVVAIWVDADACPQVIKEILYRAAERAQVVTTLVANASLRVPSSPFIRTPPRGRTAGTWRISGSWSRCGPGDLVVTADIPLAALVIARGAQALDPRGELYTEDNVQERLAVRNLMQGLRAGGDLIAGPAPFSQSDRQRFANHLDHFLTRRGEAPGTSRAPAGSARPPARSPRSDPRPPSRSGRPGSCT